MKKALVLMRELPQDMFPGARIGFQHSSFNQYHPGNVEGGRSFSQQYATAVAIYDTDDFNAVNFDPQANARAELEIVKNDFITKFPEFKHATWSIHEHVSLVEVKPS